MKIRIFGRKNRKKRRSSGFDLLQGEKKGYVILFTTLFFDSSDPKPSEGESLLILDGAVAQDLKAQGREGYPHEICGLLVGNFEQGTTVRRVREAHPARNLNRERAADRYDLDPSDYRRIEEAARRRRLEIVGVYHSHPDHPSRPSDTDRQRAVEIWQSAESWSYLIMEVAAVGVASWQSWVLRNGIFDREKIQVTMP